MANYLLICDGIEVLDEEMSQMLMNSKQSWSKTKHGVRHKVPNKTNVVKLWETQRVNKISGKNETTQHLAYNQRDWKPVQLFLRCTNMSELGTWHMVKVSKVKCTLVQALRLCRGLTAHMGSRGIALPLHDHGTRRGRGVSITPRPLFTPQERRSTHCTGGWVGPRAGLDRCGKSRRHWDSIPGPSSL
jgi:hypothetical protein